MTTDPLRPWSEQVRLHPDVESGTLVESVFAIDLGALVAGEPGVPAVYRDARAFFRATYLTADLRRLLEEVLASLAGRNGYNRVLKLRTPFGGGKSHTLAALYHAARDRGALEEIPEAQGFADPGDVAVAVFDGEKFDARDGKTLPDGTVVRTMWGWLAWQIDPERAFPLVRGHDEDRVSPGGEVIRRLLTEGAGGRPVLLLLDEVLKYLERSAAVGVLDSTLQRQALDFFQNLTVEVAGSRNAALVYSLTWSASESLGNPALLGQIDKLAGRVDQLREPVTGDEVLHVIKRRLLSEEPPAAQAAAVAEAYRRVLTQMWQAQAETPAERQEAESEGIHLRDRIREAYPFHPALIDAMKERWSSLDAFQRTRGALRFLAACLHSLKQQGDARALLGPGDIPLRDPAVRMAMLKELGAQHTFDPVITADIEGPNARAKRIDRQLAHQTPALNRVKPATRVAVAILVYSFGGLRREAGGSTETLPPGATEQELLAACAGPDLDSITAKSTLGDLRKLCLYLHYDGVRYCFKTEANVNKLVEDAEQEVASEEAQAGGRGPVRARIKAMLDQRLAGRHGAIVWPEQTHDLPDERPLFQIAYLPLEFALEPPSERERRAKEFLGRCGDRPRRYRNGVAVAVPDRQQVEALRRAVRYLLAIERVDAKRQQYRLTREQQEELRERRRTEEAAAESALRELYPAVWLPRMENGELGIEKIEKGGHPLRATDVHERIMELLTGLGAPRLYNSVTPAKIVERLRLGEGLAPGEPPRLGIRVAEVVEAFYRDLEPPRLETEEAIRRGIVRGVAEGIFGYTSGQVPPLGPDGTYPVSRDRIAFQRPIAEDEVDLETGFLIMPAAIPGQAVAPCPRCGQSPCVCPTVCSRCGQQPCVCPTVCSRCGQQPCVCPTRTRISLRFRATREQVFKAFPAIANLADRSDDGRVTLRVEAQSESGYDPTWLRNAVEEPLAEADIELEHE